MKDKVFHWGTEQMETFDEIKRCLHNIRKYWKMLKQSKSINFNLTCFH